MTRAIQPVSINEIEFDALIEESRVMESDVPLYAVENGLPVSDAIIFKAETVEMTLYLTDTPVTWLNRHSGEENRTQNVLKLLEELYYKGEPVQIVTADNVYTNMAISNITFSKDTENGSSREIPISFTRIRTTSVSTTTIPDSYGKSGATCAAAGSAATAGGSSSGISNQGVSEAEGSAGSSASSGASAGEKKQSLLWKGFKAAGAF